MCLVQKKFWMKKNGRAIGWKMTVGGRRPLSEGNLSWKRNFDGRRTFMKDDF